MNTDKLELVIAGSSDQGSVTQKQKPPSKKYITILVSDEDEVQINKLVLEREKQRFLDAVATQDTLSELLMPRSGERHIIITLGRQDIALVTLESDSDQFDFSLSAALKRLCGCEWKKSLWKLKLIDTFTPIDDQIAEIGVNLLNAGYAIKVTDESLRNRIVNNDYQPSPKRIISPNNGPFGKQFQMLWARQDVEVEKAVANIPSVKLFPNGAYIPYLQFEALWTSPNIVDIFQCPICCCSN